MTESGIPDSERLAAAQRVLDHDPAAQETYNRLVELAARALNAPIAEVTLILDDRQVSLSSRGPDQYWSKGREIPLEYSLCKNAVTTGLPLLITDAATHPLTREWPPEAKGDIRSYASVPLTVSGDLVMGSLCVLDTEPRDWAPEEVDLLRGLGEFVVREMHRRGVDQERINELVDAVDSANDGIFTLTTSGAVTTWSDACVRLFHLPKEDAIGRHFHDRVSGREPRGVAEALARVANGDPAYWEEHRDHAGADGRDFSFRLSPRYDLGDRLCGVLAVVQDITDRTQANLAVRKQEARFRSIIENSSDLITITDSEGTIMYMSPSVHRILGFEPEELVGRSSLDLVHEDDIGSLELSMSQLLGAGLDLRTTTYRHRHKDGSWVTLEIEGRNLLDQVDVEGVVLNARDVTERNEVRERLAQAQKLESLGRLAGGVAHDFNNLLTALRANLGFLRIIAPEESGELTAELNAMSSTLTRAKRLTQQLLSFGERQVSPVETLDVREELLNLLPLLDNMTGPEVELAVDVAEGTFLSMSCVHLEQVLTNLAVNASDATGAGRVTITAGVEPTEGDGVGKEGAGEVVVLRVEDRGSGIPEDVRVRIFDPFFTTKSPEKGTGLGLATVRGIVDQAGGTIEVESEVGKGTTMVLTFPAGGHPATGPHASAEAEEETEPVSCTVLVVDDDRDVRRVVGRILSRWGYEVIEAASGAEAMERHGSTDGGVDLLLSDIMMPGMSGLLLASHLREQHPELRVLFTSGFAPASVATEEPVPPDAHFLEKPFEPLELVAAVRRVMA